MNTNYDDSSIKIIEEDYDSGEEWSRGPTVPILPESYLVELKASKENQIQNVIKSSVNTTTPASIYDFHGELFSLFLYRMMWMYSRFFFYL